MVICIRSGYKLLDRFLYTDLNVDHRIITRVVSRQHSSPGRWPKFKIKVKKVLVLKKDDFNMNLYLKCRSPNTFSSKDIVQLKVYQNSDKIQSSWYQNTRSKFKIKVTRSKVLVPSSCIYFSTIKVLTHLVQKI